MSKHILFGADGVLVTRYDSDIHGKIPTEAIEVVDELFLQTISETDGTWKRDLVTGDITKHPLPMPTEAELSAAARAKRDSIISGVAWRYERQARELRLGIKTTDNLAALDTYVQALADITAQNGFPFTINWPVVDFIAKQ